jgi:peptidoglycan/xylan/chitin deacetylase (PgdA/CDA1 family)
MNDLTRHAQDTAANPWDWPETVWRPMIERARAGRSLAPRSWPQGARCAVSLSFDADHETIPLRDADPRIRALMQKEAIPATFFYPAVSAMTHADEVRGLAAEGHEIGIHSWIHELNTKLSMDVERDLSFRAADVLGKLAQRTPVGMRTASWDFSPNTLSIIREMGLLYDSSLMADDDPYELTDAGEPTGVVELPPEWIRDDAVYFNMMRHSPLRPYTPPSAVEEIFRAEFEGAWEERGMFILTMHPHIIGHRSRLPLLARLIATMKATGSVWFATHAEIAQWCKENARTNA